jgi:hypothetical protein
MRHDGFCTCWVNIPLGFTLLPISVTPLPVPVSQQITSYTVVQIVHHWVEPCKIRTQSKSNRFDIVTKVRVCVCYVLVYPLYSLLYFYVCVCVCVSTPTCSAGSL